MNHLLLLCCLYISQSSFVGQQELSQESASPQIRTETNDQFSMAVELHGSLGELENEVHEGEKLSEVDGLKHLQDLAELHRRNRLKVLTWSGVADTSFWHRKNGDTPQLNRFEFSIDQQADAEKVKVFSLQKNDRDKLVAVFSRFIMRIGGDHFEVRPKLGDQNQNYRVVITHGALEPGFEAGDFSPIHFFTFNDRTFEDNVTLMGRSIKNERAGMTVWKGPRFSWVDYRIPHQRDQFLILEIDRDQGATVTRFASRSAFEVERRVSTYQEIAEAWVPERHHRAVFYRQEKDHFQDRSHLTIFKNEVNALLPEDAFQFSGLGLGDRLEIEDKRNGTRLTYEKDRIPEAAPPIPQDDDGVEAADNGKDRQTDSTNEHSEFRGGTNQSLRFFGLLLGSSIICYGILYLLPLSSLRPLKSLKNSNGSFRKAFFRSIRV